MLKVFFLFTPSFSPPLTGNSHKFHDYGAGFTWTIAGHGGGTRKTRFTGEKGTTDNWISTKSRCSVHNWIQDFRGKCFFLCLFLLLPNAGNICFIATKFATYLHNERKITYLSALRIQLILVWCFLFFSVSNWNVLLDTNQIQKHYSIHSVCSYCCCYCSIMCPCAGRQSFVWKLSTNLLSFQSKTNLAKFLNLK